MKFRKKPVVIEAVQIKEKWFNCPDEEYPLAEIPLNVLINPMQKHCEVKTLEGVMIGNIGDWVITGIKGEKYFCKPDIFEATYEPVKPHHPQQEV